MKKTTLLLTLLLLLSLPYAAPGEEAFFEEETFAEEAFFSEEEFFDEAFFEEEAFEAFDGTPAVEPEPTPGTEAPVETPEAGGALEARTLVWQATDEVDYTVPWTAEPTVHVQEVLKTPGSVRLDWTHYDYYSQTVKLPKGVYYVVYERNNDTMTWLQAGKTRSKSITLKNQPRGGHEYMVRAEYIKGKVERYGNPGATSIYLSRSNVWKSPTRLSLFQQSDTGDLLNCEAVIRERVSCRLTLTCKQGKSTVDVMTSELITDSEWQPFVEDGKLYYRAARSIPVPSSLIGAKSFVLTLTPYRYDGSKEILGKKKTAKLARLITGEDTFFSLAPVITRAEKDGPFVVLEWTHPVHYTVGSFYYEIYDGKKLINTIARYGGGAFSGADLTLAPGKHKLTVRACDLDRKRVGKKSAAVTVTVPKENAAAPSIFFPPQIDSSGTSCQVRWSNVNPGVDSFRVCVTPNTASYALGGLSYDYVLSNYGASAVNAAPDAFSQTVTIPSAWSGAYSYVVTVQGITRDGKVYTSEAWKMTKYGSSYVAESVQLDR